MNQLERFHRHISTIIKTISADTEKFFILGYSRMAKCQKVFEKKKQVIRKMIFIWHSVILLTAMACCFEMYNASEK